MAGVLGCCVWECCGNGVRVTPTAHCLFDMPLMPPSACLQTLAGIMSGQQRAVQHPILEPFYRLLADLKEKVGPLRFD